MSLTSLIDLDLLSRFKGKIDTLLSGKLGKTENAYRTASIPMGQCDSTSTATAFTATVDGITELRDGVCILLKNGVVTSASGFTININSLGAKPVYNNMAAAGRETTIFNVNYTLLLIYDEDRVDGGCWVNYRGYYTDSNTVPTGYCTTAAGTAAKSATCTYGYRDDDNYFPCLFRYANTAANATLAIASYATTAAPIYVNGARTSSSNTFGRGVILFLYHNGAYYCYNDGRFPILVDGAVTSVQEYIATKYTLPSGGIPKTDLASAVQTSLGKADTALQSFTETDPTVPAWAKASSKPTYTASEVGALPANTAIPSKTSDLTNDSGFITGYTETDPTVPSWAKASSKPSYTKSEVGLGNVDNVQQYSASNPPPYPVTSVNGNTGDVTISIPTKTSDLTNDSNFATTSQVDTVIRSQHSTTDYRDELVVSRNGNNYYFQLGVSYFFFVYDGAQEQFTNTPTVSAIDSAIQAGTPVVAILDYVTSGPTHNYFQLEFANSGGCRFFYEDETVHREIYLDNENWQYDEYEPEWMATVAGKVDKETGKGLSTNDYTTAEKNKLAGIASSAQVNVIETVKRNGTALTVTNKAVDISVPTKTSDLTNDSGFGTYSKPSGGIPKTDLASAVQTSLGKADTALQAHQSLKTVNDNSLVGTGNISITGLPAVTASDNGKYLKVVNGVWAAATLPTYNGGVS